VYDQENEKSSFGDLSL